MKAIRLAVGVGTVWLSLLAGGAQAYVVDWRHPYPGGNIQGHSLGKTGWSQLLHYDLTLGWNRSVQMWQAVNVENQARNRVVRGISFQVMHATEEGTFDLNIYEGIGVGGRLVSSTKLAWDNSSVERWYGFKLDVPVTLKADTYTFAIENLILPRGGSFGLVVDENYPGVNAMHPGFDSRFWQYDFASHNPDNRGEWEVPWPRGNGNETGLRSYNRGTHNCRINYFFLE